MNDKELKKLNRKELLEILLSQAKLIEELESELARTQKELNNKTIILKEAGSIAEATLRLSGIFEKAQEVADEYLNSIKESKDLLVKNERGEYSLGMTKKQVEEYKKKESKRKLQLDPRRIRWTPPVRIKRE